MIRSTVFHFGFSVLLLGGYAVAQEPKIPRPEHPRPESVRANWANLGMGLGIPVRRSGSGPPRRLGEARCDRIRQVHRGPFPWESELSGIQDQGGPEGRLVSPQVQRPKGFPADQRVWLRFGAVDWRADVWVTARRSASMRAGTRPSSSISPTICARRREYGRRRRVRPDRSQPPTGKQVGWYTPTSGIWQTVWLEARPKSHISGFRVTTSIDPARVTLDVNTKGLPQGGEFQLRAEANTRSRRAGSADRRRSSSGGFRLRARSTIDVPDPKLWTRNRPSSTS